MAWGVGMGASDSTAVVSQTTHHRGLLKAIAKLLTHR